ncbi:MAG: hypothetical protein K2G65_00240, partial [Eubacterium sp.]|nr:hypothetical protein [Eubacterium sp.]
LYNTYDNIIFGSDYMKIINEDNTSTTTELILSKKPTAQAKELAIEFMRDLQPHSRQDIINYIKKRGKELGLNEFRPGCLSGGIQDMASMSECRKLGTGLYQFVSSSNKISLIDQACSVCENAIGEIQKIARQIDFITATEKDREELNELRNCIDCIENIITNLNNNH